MLGGRDGRGGQACGVDVDIAVHGLLACGLQPQLGDGLDLREAAGPPKGIARSLVGYGGSEGAMSEEGVVREGP